LAFFLKVDRFAAACDQGEGKLALKGTGVLRLSRKQTQCTLQAAILCSISKRSSILGGINEWPKAEEGGWCTDWQSKRSSA